MNDLVIISITIAAVSLWNGLCQLRNLPQKYQHFLRGNFILNILPMHFFPVRLVSGNSGFTYSFSNIKYTTSTIEPIASAWFGSNWFDKCPKINLV